MSGIIDSYKKVFENKQAHVWLAIVALIWGVTSTLLDIKLGNGDTPKNNIIDLIFSFGIYFLYRNSFIIFTNIDSSCIINFVCSRLLYFLSLRRRFEYQRIIQHCTDFLIFQGSV